MNKFKLSTPVELMTVGASICLMLGGSLYAHAQKGYVQTLETTHKQLHKKVKVEKDAKDLAEALKHQNKVDYAINPKKGTKQVSVYSSVKDVQKPVAIPKKVAGTNTNTTKKVAPKSKEDTRSDGTVGNVSTAKLGVDLVTISNSNVKALENVNLNALKATKEMTYHGKTYIYLIYTDSGKPFGWVLKDFFSTANYQQELKRRINKQIAEENRKHKEAIRIANRKDTNRYLKVTNKAKLYTYPSGDKSWVTTRKFVLVVAKVTLHNKSVWYMTADHKYISAKDSKDVTKSYVEYTADGGFKVYKNSDVGADNAKRLTDQTMGTTDQEDTTNDESNGISSSPTTDQIDLDKLSAQTGVAKDKLKELNVGIDSNNLIPNGYVIHMPVSTYDAGNYTDDSDTANFINYLAGFAPVIKAHHILPSVLIGQAILESQGGQSQLSVDDNNLFGIKGSYLGSATNYPTKEYSKGNYITVNSNFRSYPSFRESVLDYINMMETAGNYDNVFNASTSSEAIEAVKEAGYATDPNYVSSVEQQIQQYHLDSLDK